METELNNTYPHRDRWTYLSFCGVAPLYDPARQAAARFDEEHSLNGAAVFARYHDVLPRLHASAASLLRVDPADISFVKNTAEGLSLIAAGYPFEEGDEVVGYVHEYPSNHYPWLLQERSRRIRFKIIGDNPTCLLSGPPQHIGPTGFTMQDIEDAVTERTRIIALSHVQFTSGFALDLPALGEFCRQRNIDLVIDAAQSLGALPLYPGEWGIAAIASSGWKWLMGPLGTGLLYTSPDFRAKIEVTMAGADLMEQGQDYLNHSWRPRNDGRRFEYSTTHAGSAVALDVCLRELPLASGPEAIRDHIYQMQDVFLDALGPVAARSLRFQEKHRSGILSLALEQSEELAKAMCARGFFCTSRGGYLRIAPHLPNTADDMRRAARALREIL